MFEFCTCTYICALYLIVAARARTLLSKSADVGVLSSRHSNQSMHYRARFAWDSPFDNLLRISEGENCMFPLMQQRQPC